MTSSVVKVSQENFSFSSCVKSDVWHPEKDAKGYEWWYFDALNDDGNEAVVIIFLDNFIFSPDYNNLSHKRLIKKDKSFPAVAFIYYKDGKPVYRAINQYKPDEFKASTKTPKCQIGDNFFHLETAPYGSGYILEINVNLRKKRILKARFEWLSIEHDLQPQNKELPSNTHFWNLVSPRSDVTGRITVENKHGKKKDEIKFRGTGYHDHNLDNRWLPDTLSDWQWGRAHFVDTTAVYYRYNELGKDKTISKLFLTRDHQISEKDAVFEVQETSRDKFGLKYPKRLKITTEDNVKLRIKQNQIIDSSFFYLRFLSEMTLTLRDGKPRKTIGITEHLEPKTLKYRWLDWLVKMRIGKDGKSPFLP